MSRKMSESAKMSEKLEGSSREGRNRHRRRSLGWHATDAEAPPIPNSATTTTTTTFTLFSLCPPKHFAKDSTLHDTNRPLYIYLSHLCLNPSSFVMSLIIKPMLLLT
jgi:hypothetical protein